MIILVYFVRVITHTHTNIYIYKVRIKNLLVNHFLSCNTKSIEKKPIESHITFFKDVNINFIKKKERK
jgi:hypothetical protein